MAKEESPSKKQFAGRYDSIEDLEKGYKSQQTENAKLKNQYQQLQKQLDQQLVRQEKRDQEMLQLMADLRPREPQRPLVNEEGALDENALLQQIDGLTQSINSLQTSIPGIVDQQLQGLLAPLQSAQQAKNEFISENPDFSESTFNTMLAGNEGLNRVFQSLVANPDTAKDAYATVWAMAKSNKPSTSAVDEKKKISAGNPAPSHGPSPDIPGEDGLDYEKLKRLRDVAQATGDPIAGVKFMEAMMEGSTEFEKLKEMERNR